MKSGLQQGVYGAVAEGTHLLATTGGKNNEVKADDNRMRLRCVFENKGNRSGLD